LLTSVGIGAEAVWAAIKKRSKRLLVRQRDDGMKRSAADEVECQRQSGVVRPRRNSCSPVARQAARSPRTMIPISKK